MKKIAIVGLALILMLPLIAAGCAPGVESVSNNHSTARMLEITLDEFSDQANRVEYFPMAYPAILTVRLGSNPTTGYSWAVTDISDPGVVVKVSNSYEEPTATNIAGAGGTEVWVFNTTGKGWSIIKMSYSQPWEGGQKDLFTLSIDVNVKLFLIYSTEQ